MVPPTRSCRPIGAVVPTASRSIPEIVADIRSAEKRADLAAVSRLERELSRAADAATHLTGGKRGD